MLDDGSNEYVKNNYGKFATFVPFIGFIYISVPPITDELWETFSLPLLLQLFLDFHDFESIN